MRPENGGFVPQEVEKSETPKLIDDIMAVQELMRMGKYEEANALLDKQLEEYRSQGQEVEEERMAA